MLKVAPTLIVEKIEPSLEFWTERLGFSKIADVVGETELVFAMVVNGNVEVHFQTRASAAKGMPFLADNQRTPSSFLYIDVEDVGELYNKLSDCDIVTRLEKTFYGATHFFIREPGGHIVGFTQNG